MFFNVKFERFLHLILKLKKVLIFYLKLRKGTFEISKIYFLFFSV